MQRLKISIETLAPVVISSGSNTTIMTETHSAFSGSIIRGVLAARYVEVQKLGEAAFRDKTFRDIFYGGLKFLPANPEISGARSIVLPLSLQKAKAGTENENAVEDWLTEQNPSRGYKPLRGYGAVAGGKIQPVSVAKNIFMHMSRSGETERLAGKSLDGQIYNYESLDAGQIFQGEIIGDGEILQKLIRGLNLRDKNLTAYVGRSRFTQYGKCQLTFGEIEKIVAQDVAAKIYLRLDTPLIPAVDTFISAEKILRTEVVEVLNENCGRKFELGKIFSAEVEVENFVVPWGMKRPRVKALAAGTVFELSAQGNLTPADKKILGEKIYSGFGVRTEEGFGQLRIWSSKSFKFKKPTRAKIPAPKNFSADTVELARKILRNRLLAQIRIYAIEEAQTLKNQLRGGNLTHFFSRLEGIRASANSQENFQQQIQENAKDGSLFSDHLKNLYMSNGQKLFDALTGKAQLPYESQPLSVGAELQKLFGDLRKEFGEEFYFEYLKNYFRFARKIAAEMKGGDD